MPLLHQILIDFQNYSANSGVNMQQSELSKYHHTVWWFTPWTLCCRKI